MFLSVDAFQRIIKLRGLKIPIFRKLFFSKCRRNDFQTLFEKTSSSTVVSYFSNEMAIYWYSALEDNQEWWFSMWWRWIVPEIGHSTSIVDTVKFMLNRGRFFTIQRPPLKIIICFTHYLYAPFNIHIPFLAGIWLLISV